MKSKRIESKLLLNKKTVSNLNADELNAAIGGIKELTGTVCDTSTCDYFTVVYCVSFQYPCTETCYPMPE